MKIIQEYSCFPLHRNFEISGGIFFIYIWCSPKSLHLPLLKTSFSKQISEHTLPAKLNYGHQQKVIIYPWGYPNTNNICSVTLSYLYSKNLSIFIKKNFSHSKTRYLLWQLMCVHYQSSTRQSCFIPFYYHATDGICKNRKGR